MLIMKSRACLVFVGRLGMIVNISRARAQSDREVNSGNVAAPVDPLRPDVDEDKLFTELLAHNQQRNATLLGYTEQRTYKVTDTTGKVRAEESGQMEYHAPDKKTFVTSSESGAGIVRRMPLIPLIASEIETTSVKQHHDSSISPANYTFELLGEQQVGPYRCFVVQAVPKRPDKYLFEGKGWIDTQDYAGARIAGDPARKPPFRIERAPLSR